MKRYALFQHTQAAADAGVLSEAFRVCDDLTTHDARKASQHSGGVLVADVTREQARALRRALMERGVYTELVDNQWLALPDAVKCRRAVPSAKALTVYDAYGKAVPIAWARVKAIAGGVLVIGDRVKVKDMQIRYGHDGVEFDDAEYAYQERDQLTIDIVTEKPVRRYRIESDRFDYSYLGARKHASSSRNTAQLVADLATHAQDTALGSGVEQLIADVRKTKRYALARQLDRELAWLLWRRFGAGATLDGATEYRRKPFVADDVQSSFSDKARANATRRVMEDNRAGLSQHMAEYLKVDLALTALIALLVALFCINEMGYERVEGEWVLSPLRAVVVALISFGGTAWLTFSSLRSWRRGRYWMG